MPFHQDDEDDDVGAGRGRSGRGLTEFDCPSCNAHNPVGEPLEEGGEVLCNYCGTELEVRFGSDGRLRLRER